MLVVKEVRAKSILNRSKVFDYCLNPYTGCQHNCRYCYARLFIKRFTGHKEPWGQFVDAKINAPALLKRQLTRARGGKVWVSSVTDPYQPLEAKYELTRKCLQELVEKQFAVSIQTKSGLVLRDLDLFQDFDEIEVGLTITTGDERVAKLFEPNASPIERRLNALEKIHSKGIKTFAFIGPILPGNPEKLVESLEGNVDNVLIDRMNYLTSIRGFYYQHNLGDATTGKFFCEHRKALITELRKRRMKFEAVF
ncbi:MAG: radical SAM protein [bacterium]